MAGDERSGWQRAEAAAAWAGWSLSRQQGEALARYARWLRAEAIPAGALGPAEGARLWERHLGDALLFAVGWRGEAPPRTLLDAGSGVGLPGIPLAVLWGDTEVVLLDRSERRARLARRAVRSLRLPNVEVRRADLATVAPGWHGVVMRAVLSPPAALPAVARLLAAGGRAVVGLSRRSPPEAAAAGLGEWAQQPGTRVRVLEVPAVLLDAPAWLLIMCRT